MARKIFRNPDAVWREEDLQREEALQMQDAGEDVSGMGTSIILLHGKMLALNLLGTEIWKICDGRTTDEIFLSLKDEFDVEADVLKQDIGSFLAELKELGAIYEE